MLGDRLPQRVRETVMHGIGLVTLVLGISLAIKTQNLLIVLASVLVGGILGEWWRIESRLNRASDWLKDRLGRRLSAHSQAHFTEGLVTASLVFCIGPVTILGAIQDGLRGDYTLLAIKSMLDGFTALALASTLGVGVIFSVITLFVYQGGLSLAASLLEGVLSEAMIGELSATGGVFIVAIGLVLLDLKRIRVANLLPALIIAPLIVAILTALGLPIAL